MELSWVNAWFAFKAAVQKASSIEPEAVAAAMNGLEFEGVRGKNIMVKRPDFGVNRSVDCVSEMHFGIFRNGKYVSAGTASAADGVRYCSQYFGGGSWK